MFGSLLPFFKYGWYGAGFAFVALIFWLLRHEFQKSPNGYRLPVRKNAVAVIFLFAFVSLAFFFSAVFAENLVPDPFRNYVTLDMGHYGFDSTTNTIKFQMSVANPETERYVPKSMVNDYDVVLGIREDSREPPPRAGDLSNRDQPHEVLHHRHEGVETDLASRAGNVREQVCSLLNLWNPQERTSRDRGNL